MKNPNLKRSLLLYVIPDRQIGAPLSLEVQTGLALEGGATAIQLRDKFMDGGELLETARRMAALCREKQALFIVNDRLDVALLSGADGVHLGQSDLPVSEARKLISSRAGAFPFASSFIIGASAHTPAEAKKAESDGADYLGIGAVFGTGSKEDAAVIGIGGLRETVESTPLPSVAIGGVTLENLPAVMSAGACGASVISASVRGDVRERTAALKKLCAGLRAAQ